MIVTALMRDSSPFTTIKRPASLAWSSVCRAGTFRIPSIRAKAGWVSASVAKPGPADAATDMALVRGRRLSPGVLAPGAQFRQTGRKTAGPG